MLMFGLMFGLKHKNNFLPQLKFLQIVIFPCKQVGSTLCLGDIKIIYIYIGNIEIWSVYINRCRRNFEIHKKANINIFFKNINFIFRPKFKPMGGGATFLNPKKLRPLFAFSHIHLGV